MAGCWSGGRTVSYTHLDVYKRQAQHQPALLPELPGLQAQFAQDTAYKTGDGEHPGSGYKDQAGDKARDEEGACLLYTSLAVVDLHGLHSVHG